MAASAVHCLSLSNLCGKCCLLHAVATFLPSRACLLLPFSNLKSQDIYDPGQWDQKGIQGAFTERFSILSFPNLLFCPSFKNGFLWIHCVKLWEPLLTMEGRPRVSLRNRLILTNKSSNYPPWALCYMKTENYPIIKCHCHQVVHHLQLKTFQFSF